LIKDTMSETAHHVHYNLIGPQVIEHTFIFLSHASKILTQFIFLAQQASKLLYNVLGSARNKTPSKNSCARKSKNQINNSYWEKDKIIM